MRVTTPRAKDGHCLIGFDFAFYQLGGLPLRVRAGMKWTSDARPIDALEGRRFSCAKPVPGGHGPWPVGMGSLRDARCGAGPGEIQEWRLGDAV
jgi:hypothetical protein